MKKAFLVIFVFLFVVILAGCGNGGGWASYSTMSDSLKDDGATAASIASETTLSTLSGLGVESLTVPSGTITTKCYTLPSISGLISHIQGLSWSTTQDANGWYTASETLGHFVISYKIRYLSSGEVQFQINSTFVEPAGAITPKITPANSTIYVSMTKNASTGTWSGTGYIQVTMVSVTALDTKGPGWSSYRVDFTFNDINTSTHTFTTMTMSGTYLNYSANLTFTYEATHTPPIHVTGTYDGSPVVDGTYIDLPAL